MTTFKAMIACRVLCALSWPLLAAAADGPGERPGDEAMTCEQIAAELSPYMQQMMPNLQALAASTGQLNQQSRATGEKRKAEEEALAPAATAGAVDPTGASKRAYQAAVIAQHAKEERENQAMLDSKLAQQNKAQGEQLTAQGRELQSNARLQRLMQLAQQKRCDK